MTGFPVAVHGWFSALSEEPQGGVRCAVHSLMSFSRERECVSNSEPVYWPRQLRPEGVSYEFRT